MEAIVRKFPRKGAKEAETQRKKENHNSLFVLDKILLKNADFMH